MKFNRLAVVGATLFCLAGTSFAQFYGGDFDDRNGFAVDFDAYTYDDFDVTGAGLLVSDIYANCLTNATIGVMNWEIRSGISEGSGGILEASGSGAITQTATGRSGFGFDEYELRISGLATALAPGTYFVGVNVGDLLGARAFVSTTSGANSIGSPIGNGNTFLNSAFFGFTYTNWENLVGPGPWDVSYGVDGEAVPEPATLVALGIGLAALAARRRRS
ncbi:MAG: PEP-CTERM sorting domain-containing protein [Armatimonadetes bacterium]|nr:PEP-CTERM sorting domain-containing protein [Armatimonadota bacterium]